MIMRAIFTCILFCLMFSVHAQKKNKKSKSLTLDSLVTKSGWVINERDTLVLGLGSLPNGAFKYVTDVSFGAAMTNSYSGNHYSTRYNEDKNALGKNFAGMKVVVSSTDKSNVYFRFVGKHKIFVEPAIASGELELPEKYRKAKLNDTPMSKADEISKLKKLLDDGALTKEEFEAEKKKILEK